MMLEDPRVWADVMRWWSPAGALLALWPVSRGVAMMARRYLAGHEHHFVAAAFPTLFGAIALWLFLAFSIVMGAALPFVERSALVGEVIDHVAAGTWTLAALACWITAIGYARNRLLASATGVTWFFAVVFAVLASIR